MATYTLKGIAGQNYGQLTPEEQARVQAAGNAAYNQRLKDTTYIDGPRMGQRKAGYLEAEDIQVGFEAAQRYAENLFTEKSDAMRLAERARETGQVTIGDANTIPNLQAAGQKTLLGMQPNTPEAQANLADLGTHNYANQANAITSSNGMSPTQLTSAIQNQATPQATPPISQGTDPQSIKAEQTALNAKGANLKVDGILGPLTLAARAQFGGATSNVGAPQASNVGAPQASYDAKTGFLTDYGKSIGAKPVQPNDPANNTSGVGDSGSARTAEETRKAEIAKQKAELEAGAGPKPTPFDALSQLDNLRKTQGVVKDTEELNTIQDAMREEKLKFNELKQKSGAELSMGGYTGGLQEYEREMNFRLDRLALREQSVIGRINASNAYINQAMTAGQQTYNNAKSAWETEYNKNLKAVELYNQELDDQQKDALAGFTTLTNLAKEGNMTEFSPQILTQVHTYENQLGLEQGSLTDLFKGVGEKNAIENIQKDTDGNVWTVVKDKNTGALKVKVLGNVSGGTGVGGGTGGNSQYAGIINTILGSGKFTKDQSAAMKNAINNGEDPFTVVKNQAKNLLGQTGDTKLTSYEVAKEQLVAVQDSLQRYYDAGGKTDIFRGNYEKVINKLGEVSNPKLVEIATEIAASLQIYRNAVSGTAYSVQEGVDIAKIFPGINKSEGLNTAILNGRMKAFDSTIDSTYRSVLGKSYDELKTLNTEPQTDGQTFDDPMWMNDYNYDRDVQYAKEAINAGANKEQIKQILQKKYLSVDL